MNKRTPLQPCNSAGFYPFSIEQYDSISYRKLKTIDEDLFISRVFSNYTQGEHYEIHSLTISIYRPEVFPILNLSTEEGKFTSCIKQGLSQIKPDDRIVIEFIKLKRKDNTIRSFAPVVIKVTN
jgi:hypothetical protein